MTKINFDGGLAPTFLNIKVGELFVYKGALYMRINMMGGKNAAYITTEPPEDVIATFEPWDNITRVDVEINVTTRE